jgi:serine/threonine protein kinase
VAEARVVAGRYRLTRQLGRGGMGAVWLGEDELAGRLVAVKELRAPEGVTEAEREVFRKRALQEARSAARLTHPNAVTLHDIIPATAADDAVYLIMEYIDGATLAQVISRDGPLGEPRTSGIAVQLLSILEAAHALGIVHRDIKPANIMITADGRVKLADFGIAHVVGGTRLTGSGMIGTPAYMAPEQLQGLALTPAVDLWALGVTLYNAVAGRNPFDRETTAATFHAILMAELPAPACAPPLATVLAGLLVRDPAQRITIAQARRLLAGGTVVSGAPAAGRGTGGALAGPATQPGNPAYQGNQTRPGGPWYPVNDAKRPAARRRTAVIAGSGAVVAAAAVAVIIAATLHSASSSSPGTDGVSTSSGPTGQATASVSASVSVSAVAASSGGSSEEAVPSGFLGNWTGTLTPSTRFSFEGPQATSLTLTGGAVNSVVGTVDYPNVGCHYNLRLISISAATHAIELYEEIQSGPCMSEYVTLAHVGTGLTESVYQGEPNGQQPDFYGELTGGTAGLCSGLQLRRTIRRRAGQSHKELAVSGLR